MPFLNQNIVITNAQQAFLAGMQQYCYDLVYGNPSEGEFSALLRQFSLLVMVCNPCNNLTNQEIECFYNLLNTPPC